MKVILTGATGAVQAGIAVLRRAILDPSISKVTILSRRTLPDHIPASEKVARIEHSDFLAYPPELLAHLKDHGTCIWALGKSSIGMTDNEYTRITYDYPMAALKAFVDAGIRGEDGKFRFVYISGQGVRTDGKGALFARVKGRAEKDLAAFAAESTSIHVYNIRPGYFFPTDPQDAVAVRTLSLRAADKIARPIFKTFIPRSYIDTEDLRLFALEAGKGRVDAGTFSNREMLELAKQWKESKTMSEDA